MKIDWVKFRILLKLFDDLSERRELFSQLGREGVTLKKAAWMYYILSGLMTLLFLITRMRLDTYFIVFLAMTGFLLLALLLGETNNSLVNPVEALVLAHQPVDGATYAFAKLTHLGRLLLYFVPGLNAVPAVAGLFVEGSRWYYPVVHMAAAFGVGIVMALFCCALFGWLIRFVPAPRLKAAGFVAESLPWLLYLSAQAARPFRGKNLRIPEVTVPDWVWWVLGAVAVWALVFGIRSLSVDYLVRVTAIAQGRTGQVRVRRSWLGSLVGRFGGPAARAGFDYLGRMMERDWHFRRQLIPMVPLPILAIGSAAAMIRTSPFDGGFTAAHFLPHAFGFAMFLMCMVILYGSDHRGTWLFLLAPTGVWYGFARGLYFRLFLWIGVPHAALLAVLPWFWGVGDAVLFVAYSLALSAVYLGLELRLIDGMPFGKQPEASQRPEMVAMMMLGGAVMGLVVAAQHFLLFRSWWGVVGIAAVLGVVAWRITVKSLDELETAIRFHTANQMEGGRGIYTEV